MRSVIADELKMKLAPVALIFSDDRPAEALPLEAGRRGCLVSLLRAAAEGETVAIDLETVGCPGGSVGLGFVDKHADPEGMAHFLSTGGGPRGGRGEGYKKTPEIARAMFETMPPAGETQRYRVFKPLAALDPALETPRLVVFLANADQLSALAVLANYGRVTNDNVVTQFGSGCWSFCRGVNEVNRSGPPRAMIGLTDISARSHVPADVLSFTVPWAMFLEMEGNVRGSFFDRDDWQKVKARL